MSSPVRACQDFQAASLPAAGAHVKGEDQQGGDCLVKTASS